MSAKSFYRLKMYGPGQIQVQRIMIKIYHFTSRMSAEKVLCTDTHAWGRYHDIDYSQVLHSLTPLETGCPKKKLVVIIIQRRHDTTHLDSNYCMYIAYRFSHLPGSQST